MLNNQGQSSFLTPAQSSMHCLWPVLMARWASQSMDGTVLSPRHSSPDLGLLPFLNLGAPSGGTSGCSPSYGFHTCIILLATSFLQHGFGQFSTERCDGMVQRGLIINRPDWSILTIFHGGVTIRAVAAEVYRDICLA